MTELPYMIITADVRDEHRAVLPAVTHVNGSARVQTVDAVDNREFHTLLRAVGRATGREMVLNTSFNVKGQPVVNTPREALETFLSEQGSNSSSWRTPWSVAVRFPRWVEQEEDSRLSPRAG